MIRYLNQPLTPLSKKQPFTGHNNFPAMITLLIESMNKSPAKKSNFIVVKVVHGGDRSPQYEACRSSLAAKCISASLDPSAIVLAALISCPSATIKEL